MNFLFWCRRRDETPVSQDWLKDRARRESRVEFHGVGWRWPVRKIVNESAVFNTQKLRKRA